MDELDLPSRLFESGYEPSGRKRVNSYFHLRWIDIVKSALDNEHLEMLSDSQFGRILQMGVHTFSVMFLHYLLSRQLVTEKEFELWWVLVGKPIRYAIQDFAFVTGLNCGESRGNDSELNEKGLGRGKATGKLKASSSSSIWDELFRGEEKPTVNWIMDRLVKGKRYKDSLTRFRLALLVLVEGILCPTCGTTKIRPEVVSRLGNIEEFLKHPWGRESFLLTVRSAKAKTPEHYIQETMALQGFTHAMVLVAVTACPSIIVKAGGGDPLADSSLSTSEIIGLVVDRKLTVNPVTAKSVDQLGQADVRYYICDDADGELLSRGLGDKDDACVDKLVSMIEEDYPFEHNMWYGGVRADDVKSKKCPPQSPHSSGDNVSSAVDKEKDTGGAADSNVKSRDRRGHTRLPPSADPEDENLDLDVPTLLRRAADAYEERVIPMFEGYMLSLKGYFNTEVGGLRTDLKSVTTSVAALETKVATEFEKMRTLVQGGGFFNDEPAIGRSSPYRQDSPHQGGADDLPPAFIPPPHTTRIYSVPVGRDSTSSHDVSGPSEDTIPLHFEKETPRGVSCDEVNPSNVHQPEATEALKVAAGIPESVAKGAEGEPPLVTPIDPAAVQSQASVDQVVASPTHPHPSASRCGKEQAPPSEASESSILPDVSGVVTQIQADYGTMKDLTTSKPPSGDVGADPVATTTQVPLIDQDVNKEAVLPKTNTSAPTDSTQSVEPIEQSAARIEEQSEVGVEKVAEVGCGRNKRKSESTPTAGVSVTSDGGREVERRHSTRTSKKTQKFSPPVPPVKKAVAKKPPKHAESNIPPAKRSKKAAGDASQTAPITTSTPIQRELPMFIGGFNAFSPPSAASREAFFRRLSLSVSGGSTTEPGVFTISCLKDLFQCTGVCSYEALDRVIQCMRIRRDRLPAARFDFLPPTFFVELIRNFSGFDATNDKLTFNFSTTLKAQLQERPAWCKQVDIVYSPVLIKKYHWVGMIIDLHMWAIYVVDFNHSCPSEFDVVQVVTPVSVLLPYLIQKHCISSKPRELNFMPLPISRIEVPMLLEHPGFSAVASLILLELAAAGKPLISISVTEDEVRNAAENYAISALSIS